MTPIVSRSKSKCYKAQKVQKYALNSQPLALRILTNNDEVENWRLSSFLLAVNGGSITNILTSIRFETNWKFLLPKLLAFKNKQTKWQHLGGLNCTSFVSKLDENLEGTETCTCSNPIESEIKMLYYEGTH